jgi:tetratricopeptide (TPR) repeat protein
VRKALLLLNDTEVPNHLGYGFIRERAWALWLMPLGFGVLLPFASLGAWAALRRRATRPAAWLLLLVAFGAFAGVVPFTVADRYRAPMVPALLALAGLGVVVGVPELFPVGGPGRKRWRAPALACAAILVAFVPLVRPLRGRDHWMIAQAWQAKGNLPAAIAAYEDAVRAEPADAALLNNLAMAYKMAGRRDDAIAVLRRAVVVQPGLEFPHRNLAMALIVAGDRDGALAELRAAIRLDPRDARTQGAKGALFAERGDVDSAAAAFTAALRTAPNDPLLLELVSHYPVVVKRLGAVHP